MPTLLMLDLSLPKLNGLAVLRQMKTQAEWATIKVAVLTGTHDPLLLQEANELGAVAVLAKPVSAEQLGTLLEAAKI
jgi:CheY-like chemotaxis protein